MPRFVDLHCHLDLFPDPAKAFDEAEAADVYALTVTTTPKAWAGNNALVQNKKNVRIALGLHPQLVAERSEEIGLWEKHLPEARYIGEVGLDAGPKFYSSIEIQKVIFERMLKGCAEVGGKILTVHSVRAAKPVLDMVEKFLPQQRGRVVLHWFTGSKSEAKRATELGCYFSVNSAMLESERGKPVIQALPEDRLLTETDGPFTQIEGRPAHPNDIPRVVAGLAALRSTTRELMEATVLRNLKMLCKEAGSSEDPSARS